MVSGILSSDLDSDGFRAVSRLMKSADEIGVVTAKSTKPEKLRVRN